MEIIKENNLGFYNDQGIFTISAKQYDTGRVFKFNIIEDIDLSNCTAYIRILKADGKQFQGDECTIIDAENNVITVDTSVSNGDQILTAEGMNKCELHISGVDGKSLTTWNFNINVEPRVHDGSHIESLDSWDVLDKASEKLDQMKHDIAVLNSCIEDLSNNKLDKTTVAGMKELGLIKSGTDITVDEEGNVSVNDNSHNHIVSNITDLTANADELNVLDGVTTTTNELNVLDGIDVTTDELNCSKGVTSNIQTQIDNKVPLDSLIFDDSTSTYSTLSDANSAAETSTSNIKSGTGFIAFLKNAKQSFSAIVQGLKILGTNVGAIQGITDSLTATSSNVALSANGGNNLQGQINTLNSNLTKDIQSLCNVTKLADMKDSASPTNGNDNPYESDYTVPNITNYRFVSFVFITDKWSNKPSCIPVTIPVKLFKTYISPYKLVLRNEDISDTFYVEVTYVSDTKIHLRFSDYYGRSVSVFGLT